LAFSNTIVAANSPRNCGSVAPPVSSGANLDTDGTCAGFPLTAEPRLGGLADNGGPTPTHLPDAGSPVIDAGTACGSEDQRGTARPRGGACDIGAVER
jgi:hypothetical protein